MNKMLKTDHKKFKQTLSKAEKLRLKKLNDYGLSYKTFGAIGCAARIGDKLERIKNILINNKKMNFEGAYDSAIDIVNYAAMLAMELEGKNGKL